MISEKQKKNCRLIGGIAVLVGILMLFIGVFAGIGILVLGLILFFVGLTKENAELKVENQEKENTRKKFSLKRVFYGVMIAIFLPILIIVLIIAIFGNKGTSNTYTPGNNTSNTKTIYVPNEIDLYIQAQEFVKQGLKAPSTAKFPSLSYETTDLGDGRYKIISYVDSQNSFGAMLRSEWTVVMKNISVDKWILERMVIGGKVIYDPAEAKIKAKKAAQDKAELDAQIKATQKQIDDELEKLKSY